MLTGWGPWGWQEQHSFVMSRWGCMLASFLCILLYVQMQHIMLQ
jgi:hypothetical protein